MRRKKESEERKSEERRGEERRGEESRGEERRGEEREKGCLLMRSSLRNNNFPRVQT